MRQPTTIELTDKSLKLQKILSICVAMAGLMSGVWWMFLGGLMWGAINEIRIWWEHG